MPQTINLQIPFESLVNAIASLSLPQKQQLVDLIEAAIAQEEDLLEQNPTVLAEVEAARRTYRSGDYQTTQDYIASCSNQSF